MHRTAHSAFSMGISLVLPYLFGLSPFILLFCAVFGFVLGFLPDFDLRLGIKHRSWKGTHGPYFFLLMTSIFTAIIVGISYLLNNIYNNGNIFITDRDGLGYFHESVIDITIVWFALLIGISSHLLLDVTHAGVDFSYHHVSGAISSSNPVANFFFASIGVISTISILFSAFLVDYYKIMSSRGLYIVLISLFSVSFLIIVFSIVIEKKRRIQTLYCGTIKGVQMCSVNKNCVNANGKKVCFDNK